MAAKQHGSNGPKNSNLRWREDRGAWHAQALIGRDENGKQRWATRSIRAPNTRAGKRIAQEGLAEVIVEANRRRATTAPAERGETLRTTIERWADLRAPHLAPSFPDRVATAVGWLDRTGILDSPTDQLTARDLERAHAFLATEGALKRSGGLSRSSLALVDRTVRAAVRASVARGELGADPFAGLVRVASSRRSEDPPDPVMVRELLGLASESSRRFGLLVRLAATTGARRGELCGLRWSDVEGGVMRIGGGVTLVDGRAVRGATKTEGSVRSVPLPSGLVELLEEWRVLSAPAGAVFVFGLGSGPPRPDWVTSQWARVRSRVEGAERVKFHDLRHFAATQMLGAGVDLATVAGVLGHADPSVTARVYSHVLQDKLGSGPEALEAVLQ